jgi:hypothetical protein
VRQYLYLDPFTFMLLYRVSRVTETGQVSEERVVITHDVITDVITRVVITRVVKEEQTR